MLNKKVLLRERKRHTDRRVASTGYAAPAGGYPRLAPPARGYPRQAPPAGGYPGGCPLLGGYPRWVPPCGGYPGWVPPYWGYCWVGGCTPDGGVPQVDTPLPGGYPGWVPPCRGVPQAGAPWQGYTRWVPPAWTWDGVPPHLDLGWGTPLPLTRCELTDKLKI